MHPSPVLLLPLLIGLAALAAAEPRPADGIVYLEGGRLDPDGALPLVQDWRIEPEDEPRLSTEDLQTKNATTVRLYGFRDSRDRMWCTIATRKDDPVEIVFVLEDGDDPVKAFRTIIPGSPPPLGDHPFARTCFVLPVPRDDYDIRILRSERSLVEPTVRKRGARRVEEEAD